jgi:hypothetical protein
MVLFLNTSSYKFYTIFALIPRAFAVSAIVLYLQIGTVQIKLKTNL